MDEVEEVSRCGGDCERVLSPTPAVGLFDEFGDEDSIVEDDKDNSNDDVGLVLVGGGGLGGGGPPVVLIIGRTRADGVGRAID